MGFMSNWWDQFSGQQRYRRDMQARLDDTPPPANTYRIIHERGSGYGGEDGFFVRIWKKLFGRKKYNPFDKYYR